MKRALIVSLLTLATPAVAQEYVPTPDTSVVTGHDNPAETLATSEDLSNRMTVPIMVNGKGPFNFIIDTGADRTVISRELAAKLALPESSRKLRLISMSGVDDVKAVKIGSIKVSANRELKDVTAPSLPEKYIGADGLLGIDALKGQRILLDFAAQTMTVEPGNPKSRRTERVEPDVIVVQARSRLGQLVLVDADANGEEVWVVVDTGGQNSVANGAFRKLMARTAPVNSFRRVELLSVVGDRVPAEYAIVGKMRIGGVKMGNAAVAFVEAHPFKSFGLLKRPAMLLGMESLRSFRKVSIDFAGKEVRFQLPGGTTAGAVP